MKRLRCHPRPDWQSKVENLGLTYHSHENGPYWDESAAYELTAREVSELESAANRLHFLCIDAAEAVIKNKWWARLGISQAAIPVILQSWERDDFSLYGRFDLAYDGSTPPKLLGQYGLDSANEYRDLLIRWDAGGIRFYRGQPLHARKAAAAWSAAP